MTRALLAQHSADKLVKICGLLGSDHEGERASVPLASEDSQIGVRMRVCLYGQDRTHPGSS
jgi:hypothetical protein